MQPANLTSARAAKPAGLKPGALQASGFDCLSGWRARPVPWILAQHGHKIQNFNFAVHVAVPLRAFGLMENGGVASDIGIRGGCFSAALISLQWQLRSIKALASCADAE